MTTALLPFLRPASAVVLLSDMLFDDPDGALARLADLAQKQRRALMIVELDSMEHEIARLDRSRPAHLSRFEGRDFPLAPVDLGEDLFQGARIAAQDLRRARRDQWAKSGLVWPAPVVWPTADFSLARFFTSSFPELAILRNLVAREGPG